MLFRAFAATPIASRSISPRAASAFAAAATAAARSALVSSSFASSSSSPLSPRSFSSSASGLSGRADHYATLKLPRNASKQQIKARFYELSKKMHPDAPGGSPEAFHAINDAYSVLGNDVTRAQYDRSHVPASQRRGGGTDGSGFHPHSPEARRTSGPHRAWGGAKPPPGAHWTGSRRVDPNLGGGMGMGGDRPMNEASAAGRWGRKDGYTPGAAARARRKEHRLDEEVKGESVLYRTIVMAIVLTIIVGLARKLSASAETGDEDEELD